MEKSEKSKERVSPPYTKITFPFSVSINFPGNMEYIPAVRKFVSELLQVCNFSPKFAYRTEIIIDEICSNSVLYGCRKDDAEIELTNTIYEDRVEVNIKDQGGKKEDIKRLKNTIKRWESEKTETSNEGLGLEIVRMLSERLDVVIDENNITSVHVVRKREDELS